MDMMNTNDVNSPFFFPFEDELDMIKKKTIYNIVMLLQLKTFSQKQSKNKKK